MAHTPVAKHFSSEGSVPSVDFMSPGRERKLNLKGVSNWGSLSQCVLQLQISWDSATQPSPQLAAAGPPHPGALIGSFYLGDLPCAPMPPAGQSVCGS